MNVRFYLSYDIKKKMKSPFLWHVNAKILTHIYSSFEYPRHVFWLRNKKNIFLIKHSYLEACSLARDWIASNCE